MAALTLFIIPDVTGSGGPGGLSETSPGAEATTSPNTGWTVAKVAPTVYGMLAPAAKSSSAVFAATVQPDTDGANHTTTLWTLNPYSGVFDTGTWAATMKVIAVGSGGDADGNLRYRIYRTSGPPPFLGPFTQITAGTVECGTVTNLATATAQNSNGTTPSVSTFSVSNEYLGIALVWKITGAGGATTRDVVFRKGTGLALVTPNFTAAAAASLVPAPPFRQASTLYNL